MRVDIISGNNFSKQLISYHSFISSLRICKRDEVPHTVFPVFCLLCFRRCLIIFIFIFQWLEDCKRTFGTDDGIYGTNTDAQVGVMSFVESLDMKLNTIFISVAQKFQYFQRDLKY